MRVIEKYHKQLKKMITRELLDDIVPVDCTPAAKWFLSEAPQEYWRYREDFPCVLPPAPVTWIEYQMPTVIRSAKDAVPRPARAVAALIMTLEIPEDEQESFLREDRLPAVFAYFRRKSQIRGGIEIMADSRPQSIQEAIDAGLSTRWMCIWQLMAEPLNGNDLVPFVSYIFYLDQNGQMLSNLGIAYTMTDVAKEMPEYQLRHSFADTLPFLFALSLAHCRNVELVERELPPPVIKKRKEKGVPIYKFKELVIKPVGGKQVINTNGQRQPGGGMLPLHFVRAHFKRFTEERPLFGRHVGVYWWHQHAKGDITRGEIVKTYKVEP